jgi:hypothetical protein
MFDMPDVDIDFADRTQLLQYVKGTPARLDTGARHNTGVYFTDVPRAHDGIATLEHKAAEDMGYFKLDLLNVSVYEHIRNEQHLVELMQEPAWNTLQEQSFFEQLIHIGNHWELAQQMQEPINSIQRMAMFLAVIRPGKRHLAGQPWNTVAQEVWQRPEGDVYFFKKSHSVAYAQLVAVHMNILEEQNG